MAHGTTCGTMWCNVSSGCTLHPCVRCSIVYIVRPSRGWWLWHPINSSVDGLSMTYQSYSGPEMFLTGLAHKVCTVWYGRLGAYPVSPFCSFILGFLHPDVLILSCASPDFTTPGGPCCSKIFPGVWIGVEVLQCVGFYWLGYGYLSCQHDGVLQCLGLCLANECSVSFALDGSCLVISCGGCKPFMSHRNRAVRAG